MLLRSLLIAAALLAATPLAYGRSFDNCDASSDFDLTLHPNRLELTREDGEDYPRRVELVDGRLWLDNREQRLTPEDRARLLRFEAEVRALAPQVRDIAIQGVGIAVDAIGIVIAELGGNSAKMHELRRELDRLARHWTQRIGTTQTTRNWGADEHEKAIGKIVAQMVPAIAGELASSAVRAALAGDDAKLAQIEARASRLEHEIESRIEQRADRLELAAKSLCPRIEELDRIDNALALRLPGERRLNLIEVDRD